MNNPYRIAIYLRISVEDEDNKQDSKNESDSIANQRDLLHRYIKSRREFDGSIITELCDDGFSGTNFRRPAVEKLLEKAKAREIDCIIVKDFSRFGREYLEVSDYIYQIFPFLGIRFISVNDGYDSESSGNSTSSLDMAFRNIIYGYYSKDLSVKVKSAKISKAKKGDYLSPYAPFGYRKSRENKNKLVVDEDSAAVVKRIFRMACMGMNTAQIAGVLNAENVPTPHIFKNNQGIYHPWPVISDNCLWGIGTVAKVLRDERYLGHVIYGKRYRPEVGSGKTLKSGKDNWIMVEEQHEPLVTPEDFKAAQAVMTDFTEIDRQEKTVYLLTGKIKCGVCGYALSRRNRAEPDYSCMTRRTAGIECGCLKGHIKESDIAEILLAAIRAYVAVMLDEEILNKTVKMENKPLNLRGQIEESETSVKRIKEQKAVLYESHADGLISREKYETERDRLSNLQSETENRIKELADELSKLETASENPRPAENKLRQYLAADTLTREMVEVLIDSVSIYTDRSMRINWRFG